MRRATLTIHPLHFEDLEPHRFEDLVRQLAYRYRPWRYLEATGRLGRDQGLDIRGIEVVTASHEEEPLSLQMDTEEASEGELVSAVADEREWRMQCKRYKKIGPKLMRDIVSESIRNAEQAPYGLIVAAACDVSAETMSAFREEALARGVVEAHLWTKAHLEDILFLPENDHLLFAYFGISLGPRRRSQLRQIRDLITLKRKLLRAFKLTEMPSSLFQDVLIRDIEDEHYPYEDEVPDYDGMRCTPWHLGTVEDFAIQGLYVCRSMYDGWVREDGTWDLLEATDRLPATMMYRSRLRGTSLLDETEAERQERERHRRLYELVPENERKIIRELWLLPYSHIVEVDPLGDTLYDIPHLYCRFDNYEGPYANSGLYLAPGQWTGDTVDLNPENHRPLFAPPNDGPSADA